MRKASRNPVTSVTLVAAVLVCGCVLLGGCSLLTGRPTMPDPGTPYWEQDDAEAAPEVRLTQAVQSRRHHSDDEIRSQGYLPGSPDYGYLPSGRQARVSAWEDSTWTEPLPDGEWAASLPSGTWAGTTAPPPRPALTPVRAAQPVQPVAPRPIPPVRTAPVMPPPQPAPTPAPVTMPPAPPRPTPPTGGYQPPPPPPK